MKSGLTGARRRPSKASWSGFKEHEGDRKQKRERENVREEGRQKASQRTRENSSNTREIKKVILTHLRKALAAGSVKGIDHRKKQVRQPFTDGEGQ